MTINAENYGQAYEMAKKNPDTFWGEAAQRLDWSTPFTKVMNAVFSADTVSIKWFEDGALNVSANCVDRHADKTPDCIAVIFEGDEPDDSRTITYAQLKTEVCRAANVLKALGVKKGDRVTIYMPMIPEAAFAMLAVRVSAPFIQWSLAGSRPKVWQVVSMIVRQTLSLPPMRACAAVKKFL